MTCGTFQMFHRGESVRVTGLCECCRVIIWSAHYPKQLVLNYSDGLLTQNVSRYSWCRPIRPIYSIVWSCIKHDCSLKSEHDLCVVMFHVSACAWPLTSGRTDLCAETIHGRLHCFQITNVHDPYASTTAHVLDPLGGIWYFPAVEPSRADLCTFW